MTRESEQVFQWMHIAKMFFGKWANREKKLYEHVCSCKLHILYVQWNISFTQNTNNYK
jgi:hypothetical protein